MVQPLVWSPKVGSGDPHLIIKIMVKYMVYIYELYNYIFDDYVSARIYSNKDLLENNELMVLIEKAIKVIGESDGEDPKAIVKKINEWLGVKPSRRNIAEYIDVNYIFANSCNCGGYFGNEEIYDWIDGEGDFISKRFFTWQEDWKDKRRYYSPCRFGLYIHRG